MKFLNLSLCFLCALVMLGVSCKKEDNNAQTTSYIFSNPTSYTLVTGETRTPTIFTFPHIDVSALQFSSDNEAVAQVDATGRITATGVGDATISITATSATLSATCKVSVVEVNDLSNTSRGTANCYIISAPGAYKFKAVKGNTNTAVAERVDTAAVLWKSFNTSSVPILPASTAALAPLKLWSKRRLKPT